MDEKTEYLDQVGLNEFATSSWKITKKKITEGDDATLASAKKYTDNNVSTLNTNATNNLAAAKSYANTLVTNLRNDGTFNGNVTAKGGNLYLGSYRIYVG